MNQPLAVLDTWPFVEAISGVKQPVEAWRKVTNRTDMRFAMSVVNLGELWMAIAAISGVAEADLFIDRIEDVVEVEVGSAGIAKAAGWIAHTFSLTLGASFAAATAMRLNADLWTGDPQLLCRDRLWSIEDLRTREQQIDDERDAANGQFEVGRRPGVLPKASKRQLTEVVQSHLCDSFDRWEFPDT